MSFSDFGDQRLDVIAYLAQHLVRVHARLTGHFQVLFALRPEPLDLFVVLDRPTLKPDQPDQKRNETDNDWPECFEQG